MVDFVVSWPSAPLTESLVRRAIEQLGLQSNIVHNVPDVYERLVQWSTYDHVDHLLTLRNPSTILSSCYTFRKALIRKHFLSRCIHSYVTKRPTSLLRSSIPRTFDIEISFPDELDEMWSDDLWDLGQELDSSSSWWIVKPGMADRGMGIRLINSKEALRSVFDEFDEEETTSDNDVVDGTAVATSQLRYFVIQEYITNPLLIDPWAIESVHSPSSDQVQGYKFHLRAYCVASGALRLYLYDRVLALFADVPYVPPDMQSLDLRPHLTNTSLQTARDKDTVRLLTELVGHRVLSMSPRTVFDDTDALKIMEQMREILSETFKAGLENPVHFQPIPNAFELYGVDFLVAHSFESSARYTVKLLEINSEPAIEMTGARLKWILEDLYVSIGKVCVGTFCGMKQDWEKGWKIGETREHLIKCLDAQVRGPGV